MTDVEGEGEGGGQVGHMEEEALRRRQKIQELRNKRKVPGGGLESEESQSKEKAELPKCVFHLAMVTTFTHPVVSFFIYRPKFRSYTPADSTLKNAVLPSGKPENGNAN